MPNCTPPACLPALFRSLTQFYDKPMTWASIPAVALRFCILAAGSLLIGVGVALTCAFLLKRFEHADGSRWDYVWINVGPSSPTSWHVL